MKRAVVLGCLLLLASIFCFAQTGDQPGVSEQGIQVGNMIFTPSLELIFEDKDNIFLTPSNEESDSIYVARAKLMLEYPFAESYFRLLWVPQWRDYADNELEENFTHFLDLVGKFDTASGIETTIANHFVQGALEVQEIDPGQELVYGDEAFTKNETVFDLKYFFTPTDGIGFNVNYTMFSFDDDSPLWYDYNTYTAGISYQRYMNPLVRMAIGLDFTDYDADESDAIWTDSALRDHDGYNAYVQFYGAFSPTVTGDLKLGYESLSFSTPSDYGDRDYDDWSADGSLTWELVEGQSLVFRALHKAFPSNFSDASSYTHSKLAMKYNAQLAAKAFIGLGAGLFNNDYNESDSFFEGTRSDDVLEFKLEFGYHFSTAISARFNYIYQDRDSNFDAFDYTVNIWMVNLVFVY